AVIDVSAPRAIALPHLAPHRRSDRLALALERVLFRWLTISLRLPLALARIGWRTVSLRLALAPARVGHRGSRPLHLGAATLLQLRDQEAHGLKMQLFDRAVRQRVRRKVFGLLQQIDVFLARGELHLEALGHWRQQGGLSRRARWLGHCEIRVVFGGLVGDPLLGAIARFELSDRTTEAFHELLPGWCSRNGYANRRRTEGFDTGGHIGLGRDAPHQAEHLTLGAILGPSQKLAVVRLCEMRSQQQERRHVDLARGDMLEDHRELPTKQRGAAAPESGVFR